MHKISNRNKQLANEILDHYDSNNNVEKVFEIKYKRLLSIQNFLIYVYKDTKNKKAFNKWTKDQIKHENYHAEVLIKHKLKPFFTLVVTVSYKSIIWAVKTSIVVDNKDEINLIYKESLIAPLKNKSFLSIKDFEALLFNSQIYSLLTKLDIELLLKFLANKKYMERDNSFTKEKVLEFRQLLGS